MTAIHVTIVNGPQAMPFADHFSSQAHAYATFRPSYPDALGAYLASLAPTREPLPTQVWDCATGSGQAATMLARHFNRVVATDASAAQINKAEACERVDQYRSLDFPFATVPAPPHSRWSPDGVPRTCSASSARGRQSRGVVNSKARIRWVNSPRS